MSRPILLAAFLLAASALTVPAASAGIDPVDTALVLTDFPVAPQPEPGAIDPRSAEVFHLPTIELQPADVPPFTTPGVTTPDLQPTSPIQVADLDYLGTLHTSDRNGEFCVDLTAGGANQEVLCLNEAVPAVPRGDFPIGVDRTVSTPSLPGADVPDVPSVAQGALVSTADYKLDVSGTLHWDCGRMQNLVGVLGQVQTYRPFATDPDTAVWLAQNGGSTVGLTVTAVLRQDGTAVRTYEVTVPLVGQVLAAAGRSTDASWCG